ncbi:fungal-specific transcription factor domain-containing protein [Xylariales sp. PMI_506]|nr:fungal-specific transcription factor domain-containing protein [Xylariales sp. PMI_506]
MSTPDLIPNAGLSRPYKRRKAQLACNPCRSRKTGCDGRRPYCTQCFLRGLHDKCSYQDKSAESAASSLSTLASIEKRLQMLEAGSQGRSRQPNTSNLASLSENNNSTTSNNWSQNAEIPRGNDHNPTSYSYTQNSFVHNVASAVAGPSEAGFTTIVGNPFQTPPVSKVDIDSNRPGVPICEVADLFLPPRQFADRILSWYWGHNHVLLPVLHRPSFTAEYERLWQPVDQQQQQQERGPEITVFYATLNMLLALGCQRSDSSEDRMEDQRLADEFYQRSVKLVSVENLDRYTLSVVQLLVLRSSYLLYSPYAGRCWTVLLVAIKAAQAIGLGAAKLRMAPPNQLTREMRRRVWYCCITMDRLTAATFNQTPLVPNTRGFPAPEAIDDEYLSSTEEGYQPEGVPSFMACHIYFHKLYSIGDRRLELEEGDTQRKSGRYSNQELGIAIDILADLDRLFEDLPDFLKPGGYVPACRYHDSFQMQANTLQARAMFIRLWLLQPFLLMEIQKRTASNALLFPPPASVSERLEQRLRDDMSKLCVSIAQEVLSMLHGGILDRRKRTSPWHVLYFTFAAASVIVAATLCPELGIRFDRDAGQASWDQAVEILQFYRQHVPTADKALEALELFRRCVMKRAEAARKSGEDWRIISDEGLATSNAAFDSGIADSLSIDWNQLLDSTSLDMAWLTAQDVIFEDWLLPTAVS